MEAVTHFDIITITDDAQVKRELYQMRNDLLDLIYNPPVAGYADGYDIVHIVANNDPRLWDLNRNDDQDREDGVNWDSAVDPAHPLSLEIAHVESWDEIQNCLDRMMDPSFMTGMTRGFFILAHDPKRARS